MTMDEMRRLWEDRLAVYKASGQTARAWCAENTVSVSQLYCWLKKMNAPLEQVWLPVEIKEPCIENIMNIRIGEAIVEVRPGFDPDLLLKVVKPLGALC